MMGFRIRQQRRNRDSMANAKPNDGHCAPIVCAAAATTSTIGHRWLRNSIRTSTTTTTVALFILLLCTVSAAKDWFDVVDANHDGMIDRTEYDEGVDKFLDEMEHKSTTRKRASSGSTAQRSMTEWMSDFVSYEGGGFWKAFTSSVAMILATEIGDKTFFIAAVLSMKHARVAVFAGAMAALTIMTVLSTAMGLVLPKFLERKYTHILSGILFLYFGVKLILDSRQMEGGKVSEELEEVEEELLHQGGGKKKKGDDDDNVEEGQSLSSAQQRKSSSSSSSSAGVVGSTHAVICTALTLTFVAEWGDRSQIATIALASSKNPIGVTIGGIIGHSVCTASACIGGRMLASNISEKTVSQWGGVVFLLFGIHSLFFEE
jgi:Ca2+/H+ antiporter, TMEM165/GDT1 family